MTAAGRCDSILKHFQVQNWLTEYQRVQQAATIAIPLAQVAKIVRTLGTALGEVRNIYAFVKGGRKTLI